MNPYENLANAIVLQAVKDYRLTDDEAELAEIERFFRSDWFGVLTDVNPEYLIRNLRKEKDKYRGRFAQNRVSEQKQPIRVLIPRQILRLPS